MCVRVSAGLVRYSRHEEMRIFCLEGALCSSDRGEKKKKKQLPV